MTNLIIFFKSNKFNIIYSASKDENIDNYLKLAAESAEEDIESITGHVFLEQEVLREMYLPALTYKNNRLYVDRNKVIEDKLNFIREQRNNIFKELDIKRKIAEDNDNKEEIINLKNKAQKLRNLPKNINWNKLKTDKEILEYNPFEEVLK